jgi:lipopolysaccharide biosynthesis protein
MLFHIFYADLVDDLARRLAPLRGSMDVIITFPDQWPGVAVEALARAAPGAVLVPMPNRGRDVAPFLAALKIARERGHTVFCKAHTKKSPHRSDGAAWRDRLLDGLMSVDRAQAALALFEQDSRLGLLALESDRMLLGEPGVMTHNAEGVDRLSRQFKLRCGPDTAFPAGTMFWGRIAAFEALAGQDLTFEPELGRVDGTLAHAFERIVGCLVEKAGYRVHWSL